MDGFRDGHEDRVLDVATGHVVAIGQDLQVHVVAQGGLGGQVAPPDLEAGLAVGLGEASLDQDPSVQGLVQDLREIGGQDRHPLEALDLREQQGHEAVAHAPVAEDQLALVEEEHRVLEPRLPEQGRQEAVRLAALQEGRDVHVEDALAHVVCHRVRGHGLAGAGTPVEQHQDATAILDHPIEAPRGAAREVLVVALHHREDAVLVRRVQHHLVEGRLGLLEGGELLELSGQPLPPEEVVKGTRGQVQVGDEQVLGG